MADQTLTLPPRRADQKLDYEFDFTTRLDGETLLGPITVFTNNGIKVGKDTPTDPGDEGVEIAPSANKITVWLSGGGAEEATRLTGCIRLAYKTVSGREDSICYSQIIESCC